MLLHFAIPGDPDTPTGGYGFDRRLGVELDRLGWDVRGLILPGDYPWPDAAARQAAADAFASMPDGALVLIDGLAAGALPEIMAAAAGRLDIVGLVHHPLADESGLLQGEVASLQASERAALVPMRAVICPSRAVADRLVSDFGVPGTRITVAPPGTDPGPRAPRVGVPPRVLAIGSLIPRKRHDVLIAALALAADREWLARIVGSAALDPVCAADIRARVAAAGLSERVQIVGAVSDARSELLRADLFALASEYEGYGMAFAEALSHGLPVVAAGCAAVRELVPEAAGAVVPPGDAGAMADALSGLLDDPGRRDDCAEAAWTAGRRLPRWPETAARVAAVLAEIAR